MTVSSEVNIFQLALDAVGTRSNVSATTESSREAEVCRRWYDIVRDNVFRSAFWPSTKKTARLALLAERDTSEEWDAADPDPEWTFAYSLPSDYVAARFLSTFARFDLTYYNNTRVALHTHQEDAILYYSFRNENPAAWDSGLQMAIVFGLAGTIALPLTGKPTRTKFLIERANQFILDARVQTANEIQNAHATIPEWIEARGYEQSAPRARFIMPYSPLLTTSLETAPSV